MNLMTPSESFLIKINPVWYFTFLIKKKKTLIRNNKTKHYSCRIANKLNLLRIKEFPKHYLHPPWQQGKHPFCTPVPPHSWVFWPLWWVWGPLLGTGTFGQELSVSSMEFSVQHLLTSSSVKTVIIVKGEIN